MAITRFEDLPSENSPINSENLNGNFDELGVKVGTSVDNNYRVNILFQGGNILPKGTIYNLTSGSVLLNFKVPKANTQYTMKSNIPAGEGAVVFFGSGADATVTTSNNGVSSTTPRTMTSDSNGYVTISFRYLSEAGSQRNLDLYWYTIAEGTTGVDYIEPSINVDGEEIYSKQKVEETKINTAYNCYTRKIGNMVQLAVQFSNSSNPVNISGYASIPLGTVPNNCRPSNELIGPCYIRHKSGGTNVVYFTVNTTGTVRLFNWGTELTGVENISSIITYIVN